MFTDSSFPQKVIHKKLININFTQFVNFDWCYIFYLNEYLIWFKYRVRHAVKSRLVQRQNFLRFISLKVNNNYIFLWLLCYFYKVDTLIRTTSAASTATSVPVPMAMPTSAWARAGEYWHRPLPLQPSYPASEAVLFSSLCERATLLQTPYVYQSIKWKRKN